VRFPERSAHLLLLVLASLGAAACEERSLGERVWRSECASCHGIDGAGNTIGYMGDPNADLLDPAWKYGGDPDSIRQVVTEGVFAKMPPNPDLSSEELDAVVDWIYKLRDERP